MRVNYSLCQPQNTFLNVDSINRTLNKNNAKNSVNSRQNKDRLSVSPKAKMMNMIENLNKQKEFIIEKKQSLLSKTLENGGDMKSIKSQLDVYTEQLKDIDNQISDMYSQQIKEAVKQTEEKQPNHSNKNKSSEQIEVERLSNLANLSGNIKQAEEISSSKSKVDREVSIQESEISISEIHIDTLESSILFGSNVQDMIDNENQLLSGKQNLISELKTQASEIGLSYGKSPGDIMSELEENNKYDSAEDKDITHLVNEKIYEDELDS